MVRGHRLSEVARIVLGGIRLVNGSAALLAPTMFARRGGLDAEANPQALYVIRLFGIRTVLLGADLVGRDPAARARALRLAPLVHATDTAAAAAAGLAKKLPPATAKQAVTVSGLNVVLALLARRGR